MKANGRHTDKRGRVPRSAERRRELIAAYRRSGKGQAAFCRGHHWGCLSLLGQAHGKRFALPPWAGIHPDDSSGLRATRLVNIAGQIGL